MGTCTCIPVELNPFARACGYYVNRYLYLWVGLGRYLNSWVYLWVTGILQVSISTCEFTGIKVKHNTKT